MYQSSSGDQCSGDQTIVASYFLSRCQFKLFHNPYFAWKGSYVVTKVSNHLSSGKQQLSSIRYLMVL